MFTARYLVFAGVGLAFAVPLFLWWLTPDRGSGRLASRCWRSPGPSRCRRIGNIRDPPYFSSQLEGHPILADWVLRAKDPIVLAGGVEYLGLWYSLPEDGRPRAIYLADPESQLRAEGTDTVDQGYLALARWTPLPACRSRPSSRRIATSGSMKGPDWGSPG